MATKIRLVKVSWAGFRPGGKGTKGAMAWCSRDLQVIYVRRGAERWLSGLARLGHELEHVLDPAFGNDEHHPWWHFCCRAFFPIRTWRHARHATRGLAWRLRRDGELIVSDRRRS